MGSEKFMTDDQLFAAKCAVADLKGSMEDHFDGTNYHNWDAHERTINDMIKAFCLEDE